MKNLIRLSIALFLITLMNACRDEAARPAATDAVDAAARSAPDTLRASMDTSSKKDWKQSKD